MTKHGLAALQATAEKFGCEVTITRSSGRDGAVVVFIDTSPDDCNPDGTPTLRVLLNDDPVYVGTAYDPS